MDGKIKDQKERRSLSGEREREEDQRSGSRGDKR